MPNEDQIVEPIVTRPHHGFNVMIRRKRQRMSQETLADLLNIYQGDVSKLENQEKIEEDTLEKIAEALKCPVSDLRDFDIDKAMSSYSVINNNNTVNDTASNYSGIHQIIHNTSPEITEFYRDILNKQDELYQKVTDSLNSEILFLRQQLEKR